VQSGFDGFSSWYGTDIPYFVGSSTFTSRQFFGCNDGHVAYCMNLGWGRPDGYGYHQRDIPDSVGKVLYYGYDGSEESVVRIRAITGDGSLSHEESRVATQMAVWQANKNAFERYFDLSMLVVDNPRGSNVLAAAYAIYNRASGGFPSINIQGSDATSHLENIDGVDYLVCGSYHFTSSYPITWCGLSVSNVSETRYRVEGNDTLFNTSQNNPLPGEIFTLYIPVSAVQSGDHRLTVNVDYHETQSYACWESDDPEPQNMAYVGALAYGRSSASYALNLAGTAHLSKTSTDATLTAKNGCYSLADACYDLYRSDGTRIKSYTTDANGTFTTENLPAGSYYFLESRAPQGYGLDTNKHAFEISGGTADVNASDIPLAGKIDIAVRKVDADTGDAKATGDTTLSGAQYTVRYYAGDYDTAAALPAQSTRSWVLRTDEDGIAKLSAEYKVSGDAFYTLNGKTAAPLGTYTVQETKASRGYNADPNVYLRKIASSNASAGTPTVGTYETPISPEQVKRGDVSFAKYDKSTLARLAGVAFTITSKTTGETHRVWTNALGFFSTSSSTAPHTRDTNRGTSAADGVWFGGGSADDALGALPYDTYTLSEQRCAANRGYELMADIAFTISENAVTLALPDLPNRPTVWDLSKVDATTGEELPGAALELFDSSGTSVERWTSTDTPHRITGLTVGETYTLHEDLAPLGFLQSSDIEFTVQANGEVQKVTMADWPRPTVTVVKHDQSGRGVAGTRFTLYRLAEVVEPSDPDPGELMAYGVSAAQSEYGASDRANAEEEIYIDENGCRWLPCATAYTDTAGNLAFPVDAIDAFGTYLVRETAPAPEYMADTDSGLDNRYRFTFDASSYSTLLSMAPDGTRSYTYTATFKNYQNVALDVYKYDGDSLKLAGLTCDTCGGELALDSENNRLVCTQCATPRAIEAERIDGAEFALYRQVTSEEATGLSASDLIVDDDGTVWLELGRAKTVDGTLRFNRGLIDRFGAYRVAETASADASADGWMLPHEAWYSDHCDFIIDAEHFPEAADASLSRTFVDFHYRDIVVEKVDEETGEPVADTEYTLYRFFNPDDPTGCPVECGGTDTEGTWVAQDVATTDERGAHIFRGLTFGYYRISETCPNYHYAYTDESAENAQDYWFSVNELEQTQVQTWKNKRITLECTIDKSTIAVTAAAFKSLPDQSIGIDNVSEEKYRYDIGFDNGETNVRADQYTLIDPLELNAQGIRLCDVYTPVVEDDTDGACNVWYRTNLTDDEIVYSTSRATDSNPENELADGTDRIPTTGYRLWSDHIDCAQRAHLAVSDLKLEQGEYVTALMLEYGSIGTEFATSTPLTYLVQASESLSNEEGEIVILNSASTHITRNYLSTTSDESGKVRPLDKAVGLWDDAYDTVETRVIDSFGYSASVSTAKDSPVAAGGHRIIATGDAGIPVLIGVLALIGGCLIALGGRILWKRR